MLPAQLVKTQPNIWPSGTRRVAASSLAAASSAAPGHTAVAVGNSCGGVVATGDYAGGVEISQDGADNWIPLDSGVPWPISARGAKRSVFLRRTGQGSGTIVLLGYETMEDARSAGELLAAGKKQPGIATGTPTSQNVQVVANAAGAVSAQAIVLTAGNMGSTVVNRGAGVLYLGSTALMATTALGAQMNPGISRFWRGPLFWAASANLDFDIQEDIV